MCAICVKRRRQFKMDSRVQRLFLFACQAVRISLISSRMSPVLPRVGVNLHLVSENSVFTKTCVRLFSTANTKYADWKGRYNLKVNTIKIKIKIIIKNLANTQNFQKGIHSNLCVVTTLGTVKKWSLFRGGRYPEVLGWKYI